MDWLRVRIVIFESFFLRVSLVVNLFCYFSVFFFFKVVYNDSDVISTYSFTYRKFTFPSAFFSEK